MGWPWSKNKPNPVRLPRTDPRWIDIDLTLLQSGGDFSTAGGLEVVCRYRAIHAVSVFDDGNVCVLARDRETGSWREYSRPTTADHASEIAGRLSDLGIPGRTPQAEGVVDTSDGWAQLALHTRVGQDAATFTINMQCSGFDGPDAEPLRELFRRLFQLASFETYCPLIYRSRQTVTPPDAGRGG